MILMVLQAHSQSTSDVFIEQLNESNPATAGIDISLNRQFLLRNTAIIAQAGLGHGVSTSQIGNLNFVLVSQVGINSSTSIRQNGSNNTAVVSTFGIDVDSDVIQLGSGNDVRQAVVGKNLEYTVIQRGDNNSLIQFDNGRISPRMTIRQTGGMKLIIRSR